MKPYKKIAALPLIAMLGAFPGYGRSMNIVSDSVHSVPVDEISEINFVGAGTDTVYLTIDTETKTDSVNIKNVNQILFDDADDADTTSLYFSIDTDSGMVYLPLDDIAGISFEPDIADSGDWDGDGLLNDDELKKYHTDPMKADTDGDGWDDNEEVKQFDPSANPYRFNPLVADLPRMNVIMTTYPEIEYLYTTSEGTTDSRSVSESKSVGQSQSFTNSHTTSFSTDFSVSTTWKIAGKKTFGKTPGGEIGGEFGQTYGFRFGMSRSIGFSQGQSLSMSQNISEAHSWARQNSVHFKGAKITYDVVFENPSNITYSIAGLSLTTYYLDHQNGGTPNAFCNMKFDGGYSRWQPVSLNQNSESGTIQLIYDGLGVGDVETFATQAKSMWCEISAYEIMHTDKSGKKTNFNYANTAVPARTASVLVDWGPGKDRLPIDANVAVLTKFNKFAKGLADRYTPVTLQEILEYMYLEYANGEHDGNVGLISVDGVEHEPEDNGFWFVVVSKQGELNGIYSVKGISFSFADMVVRAGDGVQIIYSKDQDDDGIPVRMEKVLGTSDRDTDSDDDGISDIDEINGWEVEGKTVKTDPAAADTDGDGIIDSNDDDPLEWKTSSSAHLSSITIIGKNGEIHTIEVKDSTIKSFDATAVRMPEEILVKVRTREPVKSVIIDGDTADRINTWQALYGATLADLIPDTNMLTIKLLSEDETDSASFNLRLYSQLPDAAVTIANTPTKTHTSFTLSVDWQNMDSRALGVVVFRSMTKSRIQGVSLTPRAGNFSEGSNHVVKVLPIDTGSGASFDDDVGTFSLTNPFHYRICTYGKSNETGRYYYSPGAEYKSSLTKGRWSANLTDLKIDVTKDCDPKYVFWETFDVNGCGEFNWDITITNPAGQTAKTRKHIADDAVPIFELVPRACDGGQLTQASLSLTMTTAAATSRGFTVNGTVYDLDVTSPVTASLHPLSYYESVSLADLISANSQLSGALSGETDYRVEPGRYGAYKAGECEVDLLLKISYTISSL